ncbi:MAG: hypothetical protein GC185_01385 [Alphaproteobacteria bacterium]|nr:hypothetical protein [Alphaproteobacteria bacterium]
MSQPEYDKLDDSTLRVTYDMAGKKGDNWGAPRLSRIFNFEARQLITLYERGGTQDFSIPGRYGNTTGKSAAVTSDLQVQNFSELDTTAELARMHKKLKDMGGKPPSIDDLAGQLDKKKPALRPQTTP